MQGITWVWCITWTATWARRAHAHAHGMKLEACSGFMLIGKPNYIAARDTGAWRGSLCTHGVSYAIGFSACQVNSLAVVTKNKAERYGGGFVLRWARGLGLGRQGALLFCAWGSSFSCFDYVSDNLQGECGRVFEGKRCFGSESIFEDSIQVRLHGQQKLVFSVYPGPDLLRIGRFKCNWTDNLLNPTNTSAHLYRSPRR